MINPIDGAIHPLSTRHSAESGDDIADKTGASHSQTTDLLDLTGKAKKLQTLQQDMARSPEFDAARVSALKEAIVSGQYEVNAENIAEKLLDIELTLP